jgi:hypothetical protein
MFTIALLTRVQNWKPLSIQTDKLVIYIYNGILLGNEKWKTDVYNMNECQKN